jgi:DNA-directed RNA polymerase specialized sigma24 family protein
MTITLADQAPPAAEELAAMSNAELLDACQRESGRFVRGDRFSDAFALELLRRAVCDRSSEAWEALVSLYGGIVRSCLRRYRGFAASPSDETIWVHRTFERLWLAVGPERLHLIPSVGALIAYLKTCAHSVIMDEARERLDPRRVPLDLAPAIAFELPDATVRVVERLTASEIWRAVAAELHDDAEREVAYQSFVHGAKPAEICAAAPERYAHVADVYRIKRNLLDRLRRSPRIREFLIS